MDVVITPSLEMITWNVFWFLLLFFFNYREQKSQRSWEQISFSSPSPADPKMLAGILIREPN